MSVIDKLKTELKKVDKPENKLDYQRFFKEKLKERYGIKTAVLRKIANNLYREELKGLPKKKILDTCEGLLNSGERYSRFFAVEWAKKIDGDLSKSDFNRLESWLKNHVDNWGACDHLCGLIGSLVQKYPSLSVKTKKWAKSDNQWLRRASAVSLINPVKDGKLLDDVFTTADMLLMDDEDLVQKGYGWMLKEAGSKYPDEVFKYVLRNKARMPRTALRYAIEKFPQDRRKEAMAK